MSEVDSTGTEFVASGRVLITRTPHRPRLWGWLCLDCSQGRLYGPTDSDHSKAQLAGERHFFECEGRCDADPDAEAQHNPRAQVRAGTLQVGDPAPHFPDDPGHN
jgi:hypothetical protein